MYRNKENISEQLAGENEELIQSEEVSKSRSQELKNKSAFKYLDPFHYMERSWVKSHAKEVKVKREDLLARVKEHGAEIQGEALNYAEARNTYEELQKKFQAETGSEPVEQNMDGFIESMDNLRKMAPEVPEGTLPEQADELKKQAAIEKGQVLAAMDFFTPQITKEQQENLGSGSFYGGSQGSRLPRMELGKSLEDALALAKLRGGKIMRMSADVSSRYGEGVKSEDKYVALEDATADLIANKAETALSGDTTLFRDHLLARRVPEETVHYELKVMTMEEAEHQGKPLNIKLKYVLDRNGAKGNYEVPLRDTNLDRLRAKVWSHVSKAENGLDTVSEAVIEVNGQEIPFQQFVTGTEKVV